MKKNILGNLFNLFYDSFGEDSKAKGDFNLQAIVLHEIGEAIKYAADSRSKAIQLIAEGMLHIFPFSKIIIFMYDAEKEKYVPDIGVGIIEKNIFNINFESSSIEELLENGTSKIIEKTYFKKYLTGISNYLTCDLIYMVPLKDGEKIEGFLFIDSNVPPTSFKSEEKKLIEYYSSLISVVISNANLVYRLKKRSERLSALSEILKGINSTLQLNELLKLIVDKAIELTNSTSGSVVLLEEKSQKLIIRAAKGLPEAVYEDLILSPGEGITGKVVHTKKSRLANNVVKDPDYIVANPDVKSEIAVPLIENDKVIGVLNVDNLNKNAYTPGDLQLLEMLADGAVIALKNAFLFEKLHEGGKNES